MRQGVWEGTCAKLLPSQRKWLYSASFWNIAPKPRVMSWLQWTCRFSAMSSSERSHWLLSETRKESVLPTLDQLLSSAPGREPACPWAFMSNLERRTERKQGVRVAISSPRPNYDCTRLCPWALASALTWWYIISGPQPELWWRTLFTLYVYEIRFTQEERKGALDCKKKKHQKRQNKVGGPRGVGTGKFFPSQRFMPLLCLFFLCSHIRRERNSGKQFALQFGPCLSPTPSHQPLLKPLKEAEDRQTDGLPCCLPFHWCACQHHLWRLIASWPSDRTDLLDWLLDIKLLNVTQACDFAIQPQSPLPFPANLQSEPESTFEPICSRFAAIHLSYSMGSFGKGPLQKIFREFSAKFPQNFRTLSWRNKTYFFKFPRTFRRISDFPQKKTFANDPKSELLSFWAFSTLFSQIWSNTATVRLEIDSSGSCCSGCSAVRRQSRVGGCGTPSQANRWTAQRRRTMMNCLKIVRKRRDTVQEMLLTKFLDIFRAFFACLVAAFVWALCPTHARFKSIPITCPQHWMTHTHTHAQTDIGAQLTHRWAIGQWHRWQLTWPPSIVAVACPHRPHRSHKRCNEGMQLHPTTLHHRQRQKKAVQNGTLGFVSHLLHCIMFVRSDTLCEATART